MDSSLVEDYKEEDEELEGSYDSDHILSSLPKDYKRDKGGEMKYSQILHIKPWLRIYPYFDKKQNMNNEKSEDW